MAWTIVNFGKYRGKGKSLPQIVLDDPDWFFWAYGEGAFKGAIGAEATTIFRRAKKIKIPDQAVGESKVRYFVDPMVGKFADIEVVPSDRSQHTGSSPTFEGEFFDLSVPRRIAPYDKLGGKLMVRQLKHYVFGDSKTRLTKDRCESFFSDASNFG